MTGNWLEATPPQPLEAGEVHVWVWKLMSRESDARCPDTFDEDERARFASFRFAEDRFRFTIAHRKLRQLLGAYSGVNPGKLCFGRNSYGKPSLRVPSQPNRTRALCFNLTHTRQHAVLAISRGIELGVDLEEITPIEPEVAENHFSSSEIRQLRLLKGDEWLHAFYRCWTQKEAILKAEGIGLNLDLASFDVAVAPEDRAGLVDARAALHCWWKLFELCPAPGTMGALACEDKQAEIHCFTLPPG